MGDYPAKKKMKLSRKGVEGFAKLVEAFADQQDTPKVIEKLEKMYQNGEWEYVGTRKVLFITRDEMVEYVNLCDTPYTNYFTWRVFAYRGITVKMREVPL